MTVHPVHVVSRPETLKVSVLVGAGAWWARAEPPIWISDLFLSFMTMAFDSHAPRQPARPRAVYSCTHDNIQMSDYTYCSTAVLARRYTTVYMVARCHQMCYRSFSFGFNVDHCGRALVLAASARACVLRNSCRASLAQ